MIVRLLPSWAFVNLGCLNNNISPAGAIGLVLHRMLLLHWITFVTCSVAEFFGCFNQLTDVLFLVDADSISRVVALYFIRRSLYAIARPSVCLSVTFVHPTQAVQIFGNISTALGTLAIHGHPRKFYGDRPSGTPPPGELKTRGIAKYSDFGHIDGYISETVQDRR